MSGPNYVKLSRGCAMWVLGVFIARYPAPPLPGPIRPPLLAPQPRHHHLPIRSSTAGDWMHTPNPPQTPTAAALTYYRHLSRSACVSLETREIGFWHHPHSNYAAASKRMHIVAPQPWTRPSYTTSFRHPPRMDHAGRFASATPVGSCESERIMPSQLAPATPSARTRCRLDG
jgi:hypothetical protein